MRRILRVLLVILILIWVGYLVVPGPEFPPLPDSLLSDEPGDTVQISGVWAYYTNVSRAQVVDYYVEVFSHSSWLGLPLPVVILSHPPEYGREAVRETTETTFLYELVHPFRDSLYINGWDPAEDPAYRGADPTQVLKIKGDFYERKVILRHRSTTVIARLGMVALSLFGLWVVGWHAQRTIWSFFTRREE